MWRALTNPEEFGTWFRARLDAPFAFTWCPYSDDPDAEPDAAPRTRVDFVLEKTPTGCLLTVSESGFSALPDDARRAEAIRMNTQGWEEQVKNIAAHVSV